MLKIAINSSKNLLILVNIFEKDEIVGKSAFSQKLKKLKKLAKFRNFTKVFKS